MTCRVVAGGEVAGLVKFNVGPRYSNFEQIYTSAIDFTRVTSPFDGLAFRLGVQHVTYAGAQVDLLPYKPHFSESYSSPNRYARDYLAAVEADWSNVMTSYRGQGARVFVQMYDSNSTTNRSSNGLESVLPNAFALGIMGYPYFVTSPICGAQYVSNTCTRNLFARWLQLVTFFPIMHLGILPSDVSSDLVSLTNRYVDLHRSQVVPEFERIQMNASAYLHPLVRPLWWHDPRDERCLTITDEFMVGDVYLVAPVLDDVSTQRDVYLPAGTWCDMNRPGTQLVGPRTITNYAAPYDVIPYFKLATSCS